MENDKIIPSGKMEKDRIISSGKDVTVVISRMVSPGKEKDYDEWVRRLVVAAKEAPGNKGVTILIPEAGTPGSSAGLFV